MQLIENGLESLGSVDDYIVIFHLSSSFLKNGFVFLDLTSIGYGIILRKKLDKFEELLN